VFFSIRSLKSIQGFDPSLSQEEDQLYSLDRNFSSRPLVFPTYSQVSSDILSCIPYPTSTPLLLRPIYIYINTTFTSPFCCHRRAFSVLHTSFTPTLHFQLPLKKQD
jgi:hypothetical protein